jgi:pyruvate dehydrogenase E2 component (dihydrolipoamide acetyltransferase)
MEAVVILEWMAKLNEPVKKEDIIVVVETAKASTEILAPCDGILTAIFFNEGDEAPVAEVLGLIGVTPDDTVVGESPEASQDTAVNTAPSVDAAVDTSPVLVRHEGRVIASPLARVQALKRNVDLSTVAATSPSGRIKLRDVIAAQVQSTAANGSRGVAQGSRLNVVSSGNGPHKVLMIHGFGADAMSWYPVSRPLSETCQVISLDLPNHGRSPQQATPTFDDLVTEVVAAFDALDLQGAHVVGHSLGAACAVALAGQRSEKVLSLTLLAPAGCGAGVNADFVHGLANAVSPEQLKSALEMLVADSSLVSREFLGAVLTSRSAPGLLDAQRKMASDLFPLQQPSTIDVADELKSLKCPLHIIWGMADKVISLHEAKSLPTNARVAVLPGVGHAPQLEAPQAVLEILNSIIGKS